VVVAILSAAVVVAALAWRGWAGPAVGPPSGYPDRVVSTYYLMWPDSPEGRLADLPAGVDVVNLAFGRGPDAALVGYGPSGKASLRRDVEALHRRGVRVALSVGGEGDPSRLDLSTVSSRDRWVHGVLRQARDLRLDGLDLDLEGGALASVPPERLAEAALAVRAAMGPGFALTLAPTGSSVDYYLEVARRLQRVGALTMTAQQYFDSDVKLDDVVMRVDEAVQAGIPADRVGIGMRVGDPPDARSVEEWLRVLAAVRHRHPGLRGAFLWPTGAATTQEWADRIGSALGDQDSAAPT
jgi:hypothetical protein